MGRYDTAAKFLEAGVSRLASGLGDCAAFADRAADGSETVERFAHGSVIAGGAFALRRIGPSGAASGANAGIGPRAAACRIERLRKIFAARSEIFKAARRYESLGAFA